MALNSTKKCVCRWLLQHQHKLKQAARSCHLKVKEVSAIEEYRQDEYERYDSEYSFKYSDLVTTLAEPTQLRLKPDVSELKFGHIFTDHMLKIYYHKALGGWQRPEIKPFENITLHPAAKVLHYAIELFEGLKAYRGVDGKVRIFRPDLNMQRMNYSAEGSGLPTFDGNELVKLMKRLISVDQEWVPHTETSSLYIRPTLIGVDGTLGVAQSESALLYTILCPVGAYFDNKNTSVSLFADPSYTRAWPGGCGDKKMGSNYGPTIRVQRKALRKGCQQVLWLYGEDHEITEVGTMNIFVFYINRQGEKILVTPPLNGLILPGVIRHSILEMAQEWGEFHIQQRSVTMGDLIRLSEEGRLLEMFGSGTACIVSPISSIQYVDRVIHIPTMEQENPIYDRIRNQLAAIQYGHIEHPWALTV